jgi:hypothetical protein
LDDHHREQFQQDEHRDDLSDACRCYVYLREYRCDELVQTLQNVNHHLGESYVNQKLNEVNVYHLLCEVNVYHLLCEVHGYHLLLLGDLHDVVRGLRVNR